MKHHQTEEFNQSFNLYGGGCAYSFLSQFKSELLSHLPTKALRVCDAAFFLTSRVAASPGLRVLLSFRDELLANPRRRQSCRTVF
jgi:hypothetical protein